MEVTLTATGIDLLIDHAQYSPSVLHKCFYWYTREYRVALEPHSSTQIWVRLQPKDGAPLATAPEAILDAIHNDLLDFALRELIEAETRQVRELLVAKAFAPFDTDQPLLAELSDPVGFSLTQQGTVQ